MLSLSIPGSAGPRSRVTRVYEPGAASRGTAPLRPCSRCAHGPRGPAPSRAGAWPPPPATQKPGGMAEQHRNHLSRTVHTYPSILAVCFYAANVSAGISQLQTSVKLKGSRGGHSQRSKNALLEARMKKTKQNWKAAFTIGSVWFCRYRFLSIKINKRLF